MLRLALSPARCAKKHAEGPDFLYLCGERVCGNGWALCFQRNEDNTGFATTDSAPLHTDGINAIPVVLKNDDGNLVPTLGFIVEF